MNDCALKFDIADVLAYVIQFADAVQNDPLEALEDKIELNAERYPADLARGKPTKYSELGRGQA